MVVASRAGIEGRFKVTQANLTRQLRINHHNQMLEGGKTLMVMIGSVFLSGISLIWIRSFTTWNL